MDRRQKRTRRLIQSAFIALLDKKNYNSITVGEIIEQADVGRATFYAHFETKDFLLRSLCEDLFGHITDRAIESKSADAARYNCSVHGSVFLHLLSHIKNNDDNILTLLSCRNNELFLGYFNQELRAMISRELDGAIRVREDIPREYIESVISSTFVQSVRWWIESGMKLSPEEMAQYFFAAVENLADLKE